jgi:RimJ/RimL family protein N-acetyltransferase
MRRRSAVPRSEAAPAAAVAPAASGEEQDDEDDQQDGEHACGLSVGRRRRTPAQGALALGDWPDARVLRGPRISLEPLRVEHAQEMAPLLDDPRLHAFIGGRPAGRAELEERYRRQAVGRSPDGAQRWLNWIVRRLDDGRAVGTVQATVAGEAGELTASVAWVVATPYQGRGYAREAAGVMVAWLRRAGVVRVVAHIHPRHEASAAVARAVGLAPTETVVDGEIRWES